jgi:hypothetical protein
MWRQVGANAGGCVHSKFGSYSNLTGKVGTANFPVGMKTYRQFSTCKIATNQTNDPAGQIANIYIHPLSSLLPTGKLAIRATFAPPN